MTATDRDLFNSGEVFLTKRGWRRTWHMHPFSGDDRLWQESCSQCREDGGWGFFFL